MDKARLATALPDIFLFYDYRAYLKALFDYNKAQSRRFSHRYIVTRAGFKSPNVLKNVMDGKRNLTFAAAEQFAKAFKLDGAARKYFLALVQYNQAGTPTEREKFFQELVDMRSRENPARLGEHQYDVFSHWWHLAIREVVSLPDFQFSPDWVADALSPSITPGEAAESLSLLKSLGLIAMNRDRTWTQVEKTIATDARVKSVMVSQFHREMIRLGGESLSRFPGKEREVSGTTLRVAEADLDKIKIWLREFRMKILGLASQSAGADQVYQLNFQFFPLVKSKRSGGTSSGQPGGGPVMKLHAAHAPASQRRFAFLSAFLAIASFAILSATAMLIGCNAPPGGGTDVGNPETVSGSLRLMSGGPASWIQVQLRPRAFLSNPDSLAAADPSEHAIQDGFTDTQGFFKFDSVPVGDYCIRATDSSSHGATLLFSVDGNSDRMMLAPATMDTTGSLSGKINYRGPPRIGFPKVIIAVYGMDRWTAANDAGDFTLSDLPSGKYTLRISMPSNPALVTTVPDAILTPGGKDSVGTVDLGP